MAQRTCSLDDCSRPHKGHGLCNTHLQRQRNGRVPVDAPPMRQHKTGVPCDQPDCDRPTVGLGLCQAHWQRNRDGRPMEPRIHGRNRGQICSIEECGALSQSRGWCPKHYMRWKQHGDPLVVKTRGWRTPKDGPCSVTGCGCPLYAGGMCHLHRRRFQLGVPLDKPLQPKSAGPCAEVGCGRHGNHHGLCRRHAALAEYRRDPTKAKAKSARRRYQAARGMDAVDKDLSLSYRKAIAADPCLYCGAPGTEVDHFYPLAKGGTDAWWNLCMACVVCNRRKHAHCGTWLALGGPSREPKYRRRQLRQSRRRARRHVAQAD